MTLRRLGGWALQSAAVGLLVAAGSLLLVGPSGQDVPPPDAPLSDLEARELADLAWSIRNEGVSDAVGGTRPEPYVPADSLPGAPVVAPEQSQPGPEESGDEEAWAAPLAAALRAAPPRQAAKRAVLRLVSLGRPSGGVSFGAAPARETPLEAPVRSAEAVPSADVPSAPEPRQRDAPSRALVAASQGHQGPIRPSGGAAQQGTAYSEADPAEE